MGQDQQRLSPEERANLVAYLDKELPEAENRAIAVKLSQSPTARREIEALSRTWELLEHLPRPHPRTDFTERTLTKVKAIGAEKQRLLGTVASQAGSLLRLAGWVTLSFVAFGAGFMGVRLGWPEPTARVARDLSIAEHLDEYRDVGDLAFLKALAASPEFADEVTKASIPPLKPTTPGGADVSPSGRP